MKPLHARLIICFFLLQMPYAKTTVEGYMFQVQLADDEDLNRVILFPLGGIKDQYAWLLDPEDPLETRTQVPVVNQNTSASFGKIHVFFRDAAGDEHTCSAAMLTKAPALPSKAARYPVIWEVLENVSAKDPFQKVMLASVALVEDEKQESDNKLLLALTNSRVVLQKSEEQVMDELDFEDFSYLDSHQNLKMSVDTMRAGVEFIQKRDKKIGAFKAIRKDGSLTFDKNVRRVDNKASSEEKEEVISLLSSEDEDRRGGASEDEDSEGESESADKAAPAAVEKVAPAASKKAKKEPAPPSAPPSAPPAFNTADIVKHITGLEAAMVQAQAEVEKAEQETKRYKQMMEGKDKECQGLREQLNAFKN